MRHKTATTSKQNMVYPCNGILLGHKKEWSTNICYNMDGPWSIILSERSQTQKTTCCMITLIWNIQRRQIHRDRKQISDCWVQGGEHGSASFFFFFQLKYSSFTMLCWFQLDSRAIWLYSVIYRHCRLLQNIEYSSLCHTIGPCCLPVLYIAVHL